MAEEIQALTTEKQKLTERLAEIHKERLSIDKRLTVIENELYWKSKIHNKQQACDILSHLESYTPDMDPHKYYEKWLKGFSLIVESCGRGRKAHAIYSLPLFKWTGPHIGVSHENYVQFWQKRPEDLDQVLQQLKFKVEISDFEYPTMFGN
jgi:hypothetical protein